MVERETGLEPATFSLARRRSTTELLPPAPPYPIAEVGPGLHYTDGFAEKKAPGTPGLWLSLSNNRSAAGYRLRKKRNQISASATTHQTQSNVSSLPPVNNRLPFRYARGESSLGIGLRLETGGGRPYNTCVTPT